MSESDIIADLAAAAADSGPSAEAARARVEATVAKERAATQAARDELAAYIEAHPDETDALTDILTKFEDADSIVDAIEAAPAEPPEETPPA